MVPKNHVLLQTRESEVLAQSATVRIPDVQDSLRKRPCEDLWPTTSEGVQGEMWDCVLLRQVSKCIGTPKPPSCGHLYSGAPCSSAVKSTTENLQTDQEAADPEWSNGCADTLRVIKHNRDNENKPKPKVTTFIFHRKQAELRDLSLGDLISTEYPKWYSHIVAVILDSSDKCWNEFREIENSEVFGDLHLLCEHYRKYLVTSASEQLLFNLCFGTGVKCLDASAMYLIWPIMVFSHNVF